MHLFEYQVSSKTPQFFSTLLINNYHEIIG